jgi:hypothetical protein
MNILIVLAHPKAGSFNHALANSIRDALQARGDRVTLRDVTETKDRTTSHIALLNQAFGKTLTADDYHFEFRKLDELPEFRPKSDDPTPHSWHDVTALAPLGIILAHQYLALSRPLCKFCFSSAFVTLNRYYSYSSFSTFPSPRMECAFLPPK